MLTDYFSHAAKQQREAVAAEKAWLLTLAPKKRQLLGPDKKSAREELGREEDVAPHLSMLRDLAGEVDTIPDWLEETFDLTPGQAEGIFAWHQALLKVQADREKALQLSRIVGELIKPGHDLRVKIYGLLFAAKLAALNGVSSQTEAGEKLGLERATVSHWKRFWQRLLGLKDETFGKKEESRKKMSVSRLRVVAESRSRTSEVAS